MFRIGEFSRLTQVTIRMLRYYDEIGLLKPAETDPYTGYRMYGADQIPFLNKIIYYRDSGFNAAEIAELLSMKDDGQLRDQLDKKRLEVEYTIQLEQEKLIKIETAKKEMSTNRGDLHYQITVKSIPACQVLSLRRTIPDYYAEGSLWQELSGYALQNKLEISDHSFSVYHDTEYKESDVDVELCTFADQAAADKIDAIKDGFCCRVINAEPEMACTMVYGAFNNIAVVFKEFAGWLQKNSRYRMSGPTRQIVHRGPWNENNPDHYLVEIQIPLQRL